MAGRSRFEERDASLRARFDELLKSGTYKSERAILLVMVDELRLADTPMRYNRLYQIVHPEQEAARLEKSRQPRDESGRTQVQIVRDRMVAEERAKRLKGIEERAEARRKMAEQRAADREAAKKLPAKGLGGGEVIVKRGRIVSDAELLVMQDKERAKYERRAALAALVLEPPVRVSSLTKTITLRDYDGMDIGKFLVQGPLYPDIVQFGGRYYTPAGKGVFADIYCEAQVHHARRVANAESQG
jgi:hypothetical protein